MGCTWRAYLIDEQYRSPKNTQSALSTIFCKTLTKRQRETLQWAADGKTMQDTAFLMGLTTATVKKHLRLARIAMNVDTTAQAVIKATTNNEIYTLDY